MSPLPIEWKLPRVVIDGRMVGAIPHGIARYVTTLAKGLAEQRSLPFRPVFLAQAGMQDAFAGFETHVVRTPFLDLKESLVLPLVLRRLKPALYHSTSFSSLAFCPCPYAVTIHDLNHLQYGGMVEKLYYEAMLKPFLAKASEIIAVSRFTEQELARWIPRARPTVIPVAIDASLFSANPAEIDVTPGDLSRFGLTPGRYFLNLSNAKPHKNLPTLLRAFQQFRARSPRFAEYKLVLSVPQYAGEPNVVALGGIPEGDLRILLRNATALPFPSLYEGFGLPPLEAAALGVVPLPSRIAAHVEGFETALEPALARLIRYTNPDSVADWAESLVQAAEGRIPAPSAAARTQILERYSVRRLGEETKKIYERVLEKFRTKEIP